MSKSYLFRRAALEKMASPDQLDMSMQVANPRSWLVLLALIAVVVTAVMWGIFGQIPVEINHNAILLKTGGVKNIVSTHDGQITALFVAPGMLVEAGQTIAEVTPIGADTAVEIKSQFTGRILEIKNGTGSLINPGTSVASLEFVGDDIDLEAILYVPLADGADIEPGMRVQLSPVTVDIEETGFLLGQVVSVNDYPSTPQGIINTLGSDVFLSTLVTDQAPIEIRVQFLADQTTPSGYRWSSIGPAFELNSGTLASAKIIVDTRRPIELVLPIR